MQRNGTISHYFIKITPAAVAVLKGDWGEGAVRDDET